MNFNALYEEAKLKWVFACMSQNVQNKELHFLHQGIKLREILLVKVFALFIFVAY